MCSLTDYFPSGEPALVANVYSLKTNCSDWVFDGKVVFFYPSGHMRKTEFYNANKLQGDVITYAEDGRILTKDHYEKGQQIDERKYAVAPNQPLVGRWRGSACRDPRGACFEYTLLWTINSNGILNTRFQGRLQNSEMVTNWKYTSTGPAAGVLEEFQGDTLGWKGDIRWINRYEFEYTTTFAPDANSIGQRFRFVRE
jgi:antitoxin component YwqK of YwqJK toxin-antitoxin module